jgi:glycine/D-amino acid oxidase-like deaminating enzyme
VSHPKPVILDQPRIDNPASRNSLGDWSWQRRQPERSDSENYYQASVAERGPYPALEGDTQCEVVVIGAGLLGASTALHLAEAGVETRLIEQDRVGASASGRNGGQLTPGLARWEAAAMAQHLPLDEAARLWRFTAQESMALIEAIAERYGLALDLQRGHLTAAIHPGHLTALQEGIDARRRLGDQEPELLTRDALQAHVVTDAYYGAVLDPVGGHLHPLALTLGMAQAFADLGGHLHEQTSAKAIRHRDGRIEVVTSRGLISAEKVVVATHVSTHELLPKQARATIPFFSYVAVTAPITGGSATLMPTGKALYDTSLQIDYYRRVRGERLLFGGSGSGSRWSIDRARQYFEQRFQHLFPQQAPFEIDYLWSGAADLTARGPAASHCIDEQIYSVFGWSGHGVAQTVRIGQAISDAIRGDNDDFEMLCRIPNPSIPFGRQLAPFAIPIGIALLELRARLQPSKLISF